MRSLPHFRPNIFTCFYPRNLAQHALPLVVTQGLCPRGVVTLLQDQLSKMKKSFTTAPEKRPPSLYQPKRSL